VRQQHAAELGLLGLELAEHALGADAAGAQHRHMGLETLQEVQRGKAHQVAVGGPQPATGQPGLHRRLVGQGQRGVQVVGHHAQGLFGRQGAGEFGHRGAVAQEDGGLVLQQRHRRLGDAALALALHAAALGEAAVVLRRLQRQPAMLAARQALLAQGLHVAPDGLRADLEARGQLLGAQLLGLLQPGQDVALTGTDVHSLARIFRTKVSKAGVSGA
jgi:hypothetical protein